MKLLVLACWVVVVAVASARPQYYHPPVTDIAGAYQAYHQLWLSEAKRNSVAPASFRTQVKLQGGAGKPRQEGKEEQAVKEEAPQEAAPQEAAPQEAAPQEAAPQEAAPQEAAAPEQPEEEQPVQEQIPVEAPVQEKQVQQEPQPEQQPVQQEAQPSAPAEPKSESPAPAEEPAPEVPPAPDMAAAYNDFFELWKAEAARNGVVPRHDPFAISVAQPEPQPAKEAAPEPKPEPTLKAAASPESQPAEPSSTWVAPSISLAGHQGSLPLIIVLPQYGAAPPQRLA